MTAPNKPPNTITLYVARDAGGYFLSHTRPCPSRHLGWLTVYSSKKDAGINIKTVIGKGLVGRPLALMECVPVKLMRVEEE